MKKSDVRKIIREEIQKVLDENKTYISKRIDIYDNIEIVTINKFTDRNPKPKKNTKVYVDGNIVTGSERHMAEQIVDNANPKDVKTTFERNF